MNYIGELTVFPLTKIERKPKRLTEEKKTTKKTESCY